MMQFGNERFPYLNETLMPLMDLKRKGRSMKYITKWPNNTRLNPTTNGYLHLGHAYMALVNEAEAHMSGGKFWVRWDDNQPELNATDSGRDENPNPGFREQITAQMKEDIEWFGIKVDRWVSQLEQEEQVHAFMQRLNGGPLKVRQQWCSHENPQCQWTNYDALYPYVPLFTAEKVISDYLENINLLIRGEDLLDEYALYRYFTDLWTLPPVTQVFLSRLMMESGEQLSDVSKRYGNNSIREYREKGWKPEDLKAKLAEACLIDPSGPWLIANVKSRPVWKGE
jgi:glutamyl/glutaminyl-tRNA synthetase